jgi:hypothetical protein
MISQVVSVSIRTLRAYLRLRERSSRLETKDEKREIQKATHIAEERRDKEGVQEGVVMVVVEVESRFAV